MVLFVLKIKVKGVKHIEIVRSSLGSGYLIPAIWGGIESQSS
jgi:hypothetical protein